METIQINDKKLKVKTFLKDFTVKEYSELIKLFDDINKLVNDYNENENNKDFDGLENITSVINLKKEVLNIIIVNIGDIIDLIDYMYIDDIQKIIDMLRFDESDVYDLTNLFLFEYDGVKYGFNFLRNEKLLNWIACEYYAEHSDYCKLINYMYRPILEFKDETHFTLKDIDDLHDISNLITANYLIYCLTFFLTIKENYLEDMKIKMKKEVLKNKVKRKMMIKGLKK